jgi:hypothetical protein
MPRNLRALLTSLVGLGVIASAVYQRVVRPWYWNWGATPEEIARPMPLDDRIPSPTAVTHRAVTVRARPEAIWPWIVQMGEPPRAGYYSYTQIERLQGMEIQNGERILPEFQTLQVGDRLDQAGNMTVLGIEPGHYVVLGPPDVYDWLRSTWVIAIYPMGDQASRLVTRLRARMSLPGMLRALPPTAWPFWILIHPGVFLMERKMLLEIKRLAETHASEQPTAGAAALAA